jgi:hypothetical protein
MIVTIIKIFSINDNFFSKLFTHIALKLLFLPKVHGYFIYLRFIWLITQFFYKNECYY